MLTLTTFTVNWTVSFNLPEREIIMTSPCSVPVPKAISITFLKLPSDKAIIDKHSDFPKHALVNIFKFKCLSNYLSRTYHFVFYSSRYKNKFEFKY